MRVPLSWLRDYVDIDLPVEEVAPAALLKAAAEVDTTTPAGVSS